MIGSPFFLMKRSPGVVFRDVPALGLRGGPPDARAGIGDELVDALAELEEGVPALARRARELIEAG